VFEKPKQGSPDAAEFGDLVKHHGNGITVVCGIMTLLLGRHPDSVREQVWLPERIFRRTLARADLRRLIERTVPAVEHLDRNSRPRSP